MAGWHDAGLVLSSADQSAGGVQWLCALDSHLLAITASGKVFLGRQGRSAWDTIPSPGGKVMASLVARDSLFHVGTRLTGQVWSFSPRSKIWTDLNVGGSDSMKVAALANFQGQTAALLSRIYGWERPISLGGNQPGQWTRIDAGWNDSEETTTASAVGTSLYATTYSHGLWKRGASDAQWQRVPDPLYKQVYANDSVAWVPLNKPRSLAWYKGNLWTGFLIWSEIRHLTGIDTPWVPTAMDSSSGYKRLPSDILAMQVWRDRLFAGGQAVSTPLVYVDGKGWRYLERNWGKSDDGTRTTCGSDITLAFAGIGDTLYAAGCGHIYKLPWSEIPQ